MRASITAIVTEIQDPLPPNLKASVGVSCKTVMLCSRMALPNLAGCNCSATCSGLVYAACIALPTLISGERQHRLAELNMGSITSMTYGSKPQRVAHATVSAAVNASRSANEVSVACQQLRVTPIHLGSPVVPEVLTM